MVKSGKLSCGTVVIIRDYALDRGNILSNGAQVAQSRFCESNIQSVHLIQAVLPLFSCTHRSGARGRFAKQRSLGTRADISPSPSLRLLSLSLSLHPNIPVRSKRIRFESREEKTAPRSREDRKSGSFCPLWSIIRSYGGIGHSKKRVTSSFSYIFERYSLFSSMNRCSCFVRLFPSVSSVRNLLCIVTDSLIQFVIAFGFKI